MDGDTYGRAELAQEPAAGVMWQGDNFSCLGPYTKTKELAVLTEDTCTKNCALLRPTVAAGAGGVLPFPLPYLETLTASWENTVLKAIDSHVLSGRALGKCLIS